MAPTTTARAAAALLALGLLLSACGPNPVRSPQVAMRRNLMGTEVTITAWTAELDEEALTAAVEAAFSRMADLEKALSRHDPESELSSLNKAAGGEPVRTSRDLWRALMLAKDAWKTSKGAFDPTVGPLIGLWIAAAKNDKLPTPRQIDGARRKLGFGTVTLDDGTVQLKQGMSIDLGGIAKGFIVDEAVARLKEKGVTNGLVEAGGDLFAFGTRPGGARWRVGVQDPAAGKDVTGQLVATLAVSDKGITTSGHYRRFSEIEGRRTSHILDPRTGRPVPMGLLSVTVVAPTAAQADGLSTAVAVLGPEQGLALIEGLPGVEAYLVLQGDEGYAFRQTEGLAALLVKE